MKKFPIILAIFLFMASVIACQFQPSVNVPTYLTWRQQVFATAPGALGITVDKNSKIPYGIVMDHRLTDGAVFTLVSFINGECSVYTDTGHGNFNLGSRYKTVRAASEKYVQLAAQYVGEMTITETYPLPTNSDGVKFYVITPSGIYTADETSWDELTRGNNDLSPLFRELNKVITAIMEATAK
jgi:hypothetical protein